MNELYLICDESGSKGFSDKEEKELGEFGIMAGDFLDSQNISSMTQLITETVSQYKPQDNKKFHITDLDTETQELLRNDIFSFIAANNIKCVYEAISVEGYRESYEEVRKIAGNKFKEERLHSELFNGIFSKTLAHFIECYGEDHTSITIITDNIEKTIKKEFENCIKEMTSAEPYEREYSIYDQQAQKPTKYTIKITSDFLNDNIANTKSKIHVEDNSLTLVADILANSLNYYIKEEVKKNPDLDLGSTEAVKHYPIFNNLLYLSETESPSFTQRIFPRKKGSITVINEKKSQPTD